AKKQLGLIMKVDKFGSILWSKTFGGAFIDILLTDVSNIIRTKAGDFIVAFNYYGYNSQAVFVRLDVNGNIKWTSSLKGGGNRALFFGDLKLFQSRNGDIIVGSTIISGTDRDRYDITNGFFASSLSINTGENNWER